MKVRAVVRATRAAVRVARARARARACARRGKGHTLWFANWRLEARLVVRSSELLYRAV